METKEHRARKNRDGERSAVSEWWSEKGLVVNWYLSQDLEEIGNES